jgi:hypothetical protein
MGLPRFSTGSGNARKAFANICLEVLEIQGVF